MANQAQHQRYIDTSSASSSLSASPNGELPLHPDHGTYGSTPIIQPVISRTLSNIPTPENNSLDPPRRRPSRLDSASGRLKEYHAAAAADENTVLAARGDPRNYAATITTTNRESIREDVRKTSDGWLGRFGAIELENKGSVARDHLALERTFLAWLRTSLAFASIGIAITQLFRLNAAVVTDPNPSGYTPLRHMGKPLGATFIGISLLVLMIGVNRYYESQTWLMRGKFPASRGSIFLLTLVACLLMITTLVIVLVVQPNDYEL
ncbi:uncharacterized protein H6S33_011526 [Morchella sextelata]|uniref:uncharacterized protein n=1 Tax=Morchella sextelata TaxID=1174677 RepID=UPI001D05A2B9|nr:uncharacterized protein H6S33_011526 [Morchella sextelata]KAH0611099.1 hypothetical protein H6S33_011526 [Morchella sextelata]